MDTKPDKSTSIYKENIKMLKSAWKSQKYFNDEAESIILKGLSNRVNNNIICLFIAGTCTFYNRAF